ncbi:hypothetical protein D3C84_984050 [compost metagenome]
MIVFLPTCVPDLITHPADIMAPSAIVTSGSTMAVGAMIAASDIPETPFIIEVKG